MSTSKGGKRRLGLCSVGIGRGTVSRGCMLSGVASLPVRKAGQRCANGYLNQMGVPVLGVGPLVLSGSREGALSGREGSPSRLGRLKEENLDPRGTAQRGHAAFFFFFFPNGSFFFSRWLFGEGIPVRFLGAFSGLGNSYDSTVLPKKAPISSLTKWGGRVWEWMEGELYIR